MVSQDVKELRSESGADQAPEVPAVLVAPGLVVEAEDVLQGDDVALHSLDLHDGNDATAAVTQARLLDDEIDRTGDLIANGPEWKFDPRHEDHGLQPAQAVSRGVGVDSGDRPVVPSVHGLQHVQCRAVSHFSDDYSVGAHSQRVSNEISDRNLPAALDVGRARLQSQNVLLMELELSLIHISEPTRPY